MSVGGLVFNVLQVRVIFVMIDNQKCGDLRLDVFAFLKVFRFYYLPKWEVKAKELSLTKTFAEPIDFYKKL